MALCEVETMDWPSCLLRTKAAPPRCSLPRRTTVQPDETVYLEIDADKAHVFDAASGQRLD